MSIPILTVAIATALPAGWLACWIVRRETHHTSLSLAAVMMASVALAVWAALVMPADYRLAATLLLGWALLVLAAVDFSVFRLPDILTLPLIAIGLLLSLWLPDRDPLAHLFGAIVGFVVLYAVAFFYRRARGREGLGLGDAKLAAAVGAWLGWQALASVVLIACLAAFLWIGLMVLFRGRAVLRHEIAFGVPLSFGFWLVWLYGAPF